jgi:hypothetical protein
VVTLKFDEELVRVWCGLFRTFSLATLFHYCSSKFSF